MDHLPALVSKNVQIVAVNRRAAELQRNQLLKELAEREELGSNILNYSSE